MSNQSVLYEQNISDSIQLKIFLSKNQQQLQNTYIRIHQQDEHIYEEEIANIIFRDNNCECLKINIKEFLQLIINEETIITITEDKKILITLKEETLFFIIPKKQPNTAKDIKLEEKLMKLQQIIEDQAHKYEKLEATFENSNIKQNEDINSLQTELGKTKQELNSAKQSILSYQKQIQALAETLQPLIIQQKQFSCFHHPYNPHSHHFNLQLTQSHLKIIKTSDNNYHNFISNLPIQLGKVTVFRVKQVRIIDGQIYMGVGTKSVFGDINSWNRDFLSYYSGDGDICENGLYHEGGQSIEDGQIVTINIDLIEQNVSWWIQSKKLAQAKLPEQMMDKKLYLVLLMKHKGDQLDVLLHQ